MYRKPLGQLAPGDVIAKTVQDERGTPLLKDGTTLTPRYIEALRDRGVLAVYVRDGLTDDVAPDDIVSERVRATLTGHVASIFDRVSLLGAERSGPSDGVAGAIDDLGEQPLDLGDDGVAAVQKLYAEVEGLINEILEGDTVAGLESLKTHNEYTFQHSVDVAVVGVLLGRDLGLPRHRLRELALGCLLHDIGKTYIDVAILDKPGPLTAEEFAAIQQHPLMGFELVRRFPVRSLLPAHVAYQHHERQRGAGYPRGLIGTNRVGGRAGREEIGAGRMLLIAEIGAVADVYSALSSDRPYRAAIPPDRARAMIARMAGPHLNREVVDVMRRLVPPHPVGSWVEVVAGSHAGWRGVVTEIPRARVDEPMVRLVLDERGEAVTSPVELDTREEPGVTLRALPLDRAPTSSPAMAG